MKAQEIKYGAKIVLAELEESSFWSPGSKNVTMPEVLKPSSLRGANYEVARKINCLIETVLSWESCVFKGVYMLKVKFKSKMSMYFQVDSEGNLIIPCGTTGRDHNYTPFNSVEEVEEYLKKRQNELEGFVRDYLEKNTVTSKGVVDDLEKRLKASRKDLKASNETFELFLEKGFPKVVASVIETPKVLG